MGGDGNRIDSSEIGLSLLFGVIQCDKSYPTRLLPQTRARAHTPQAGARRLLSCSSDFIISLVSSK